MGRQICLINRTGTSLPAQPFPFSPTGVCASALRVVKVFCSLNNVPSGHKKRKEQLHNELERAKNMQWCMWHEEYEPSEVWRSVPHVPRQASEGVNAVAKCVQQKEEKP